MTNRDNDSKIEEKFILMKLANMTITEINTLTSKEKCLLSKWFLEDSLRQQEIIKENLKRK